MGGEEEQWQRFDHARAQLLAGQALALKEDARKASELLRSGQVEQARDLVERNFQYATAIWHELDLLTRPPREPMMRAESRGARQPAPDEPS